MSDTTIEVDGVLNARIAVDQLHSFGIDAWIESDRLPDALTEAVAIPIRIRDAAQCPMARRLLDHAFQATRLDRDDGEDPLCKECRYNLRGHTGDGDCPECGYPYRTSIAASESPTRCPDCGEQVPAGFDQCWQCGTSLSEAVDAIMVPDVETVRCAHCGFLFGPRRLEQCPACGQAQEPGQTTGGPQANSLPNGCWAVIHLLLVLSLLFLIMMIIGTLDET